MRALLLVLIFGALFVGTAYGQRDPFLWPYDKESIWNMPIHNDADYYDIPDGDLPPHGRYGLDENHILRLTPDLPLRDFYGNNTWGPGRCRNDRGYLYSMNFPDDYVVADATQSSTPNNNFAFMLSDDTSIRTGNVLARCAAGGPVYHRTWYRSASVYGDGIADQNGQGASGMSAMGGTIRNADIDLGEIRHAIKFTLFAKQYFYYDGPQTNSCASNNSCYRWPAGSCDCYADDYLGNNPKLVMGALFAIRPDVTLESQNFETNFAPVVFRALQRYGGYAVEDSAWSKWYLIGERGVRSRVQTKYGIDLETGGQNTAWKRDMDKIVRLLQVVDNNRAGNIGGGPNGDYVNRRAPLPCAFGTVGSGQMCGGGGAGGPADVTGSVSVSSSGLYFSRATGHYTGLITITNTGGTGIAGPLHVVINSLTSGVTLVGADGMHQGDPYLTTNVSLEPGQSTAVTVQYSNPSNSIVNYAPRVLSGSF